MKRNTGCGCGDNDHNECPPMQACDTAKSQDHFCTAGTPVHVGEVETTRILGDIPITSNVEADIRLPSPAQDIKAIRKNVHLTQCKAIPLPNPATPGVTTTVNLFIEGFVHKNIQFSEGCKGFVRDFSVNVPFKCFQTITGLAPIDVCFSQKSNQVREIREMDENGMGSDRCSFGSETFEVFNEPVECKLLRADILQMDFPKNFDTFGNFKKITEKMTINFVVRLTQEQRPTPGGTCI